MKEQTEFINNKEVDYFDQWSEPEQNNKITFNISIKNAKKSRKRNFLNIVETEEVRLRRLELNASKAEIANGRLVQEYNIKSENDIFIKPGVASRQAELMQAKEFLKEAMGSNRRRFDKAAS